MSLNPYWRGKRVLITGITGFVGPYLAAALDAAGATICGTTRNKANVRQNFLTPHPVVLYETDLLHLPDFAAVLEAAAPDVIFHLAAQSSVHVSQAQPYETALTNGNALATVLEAMRLAPKKTALVHAGSAEVYGKVLNAKADAAWFKKHAPYFAMPTSVKKPSELPVKETAALRPLSPYAVSRVHNELLLQNYATLYGLRAVISRSFNHEGAGRGQHFVTTSIIRQIREMKASGERKISVGNVMAFRDWSHVKDTVQAYLLLAEKGKSGEAYNVGSGRANSVLSFLLLSIHEGIAPVLSVSAANGKKAVEKPLALNHDRAFGVAFPKTKVDSLLLSDRLKYDLRDKALRVETAAGEVEIVLDPARFRPADIPVLFADISKLRRLGFKPKYSLQDIVRDMTAAQG